MPHRRRSLTIAEYERLSGKQLTPQPQEPRTGPLRVGGRYVQQGTAGRAADLGSSWFKSRSERNYARWLTYQGLAWQYEPHTFVFDKIRSGTRVYKPDFYVVVRDEYHEVKGYLEPKDKTKLARMKRYFPKIKIVVIPQTFFREICRQRVCKLIPFYECSHNSHQ